MDPTSDELEKKMRLFEGYVDQLEYNSVTSGERTLGPFRCPCCKCLTLDERGGFDICPVCFWEDDGQDDHDATLVRGGPNGALSLTTARLNFRLLGACEQRFAQHVRPPQSKEMPPTNE